MKILILGSNGMLGRYLTTYFEDKYECVKLNRKLLDLTSDRNEIKKYLSNLINQDDLIINSAGVIKQRTYDINEMILVNSILPNLLCEIKRENDCKVIHITTDCVYNGDKGFYDENSVPDAVDDYGRTKILGENQSNMNIRTSIIGEEIENKKSLIEWVKSKENGKIQGFNNHIWNGLTCLELVKFIDEIIEKELYWSGTRHIFSPEDVSKYELVKMINEIYKLNINIEKINFEKDCSRNLRTIHKNEIKKGIYQQIIEQKNFKII